MNVKTIRWFLVLLVVAFTFAIGFGSFSTSSQQQSSVAQPQGTPVDGPPHPFKNLTKYSVVNYDAGEPESPTERERRRSINRRYDGQGLVFRNPNPDDSAVKRDEETDPVAAIPTEKSDLIVRGKINEVTAHLSNDKSGVYSEFSIQIEQIVKDSGSAKVSTGELVTADRAGGYVRYPNGQMILYVLDGKGLPEIGKEYLLFLATDKVSPNFKVVTIYELPEDEIVPLDRVEGFGQYKTLKKSGFVEMVSRKVSDVSKP